MRHALMFLTLLALFASNLAAQEAEPAPKEAEAKAVPASKEPESDQAPLLDKAKKEETPKTVDDLPTPKLRGENGLVTEKGSRVKGNFEGVEGGKFVFNDPEIGRVKIKASSVHSLLLSDTHRVWFQEDRESEVKEGRLAPLFYGDPDEDMRLAVHSFGEGDIDEYLMLDPSSLHKLTMRSYALQPSKWKFTGNISTSFEWHDGNTSRQNYGLNMRFKLQHPNHVFQLRTSYSSAETDGKRSSQRANGEFSYRYLFTTHNAIFIREVVAHDDFAKLAIRSITSVGLTFYFYKEADITWSLDAGASYTEEHRKRGALNRYSDGGQVSMRLDAKPEKNIRIIFNSRATVPFDAPKESLISTELNVNFNVWKDLTLGILIRNDHDSEPPVNVEHNNYRVRFLLGWSFK